ncbi:hypothetical protein Ciccas_008401 [Cichlidogyrus casuarinus]|uniref:Uncharacterized protein n=1 Tax=Cichlidogyrus casuarinus TaxID=1844966 RepID=A0ABD2Q0E0_9PLAT
MKSALMEKFSSAHSEHSGIGQEELSTLVSKLQHYRMAIVALKSQVNSASTFRDEAEHLRQSLSMSKSTVEDYRNLLDEGNKQRDWLRKELELSRKDASVLRAQVQGLKQEATDSPRLPKLTVTAEYFEIQQLKQQISNNNSEFQKLRDLNVDLNAENLKLTSKFDRLTKMIRKKESSLIKSKSKTLSLDWFHSLVAKLSSEEKIKSPVKSPKRSRSPIKSPADSEASTSKNLHPSLMDVVETLEFCGTEEASSSPVAKRKKLESDSSSSSPIKPVNDKRKNPPRKARACIAPILKHSPEFQTNSESDVDMDKTPNCKQLKIPGLFILLSSNNSSFVSVISSPLASTLRPSSPPLEKTVPPPDLDCEKQDEANSDLELHYPSTSQMIAEETIDVALPQTSPTPLPPVVNAEPASTTAKVESMNIEVPRQTRCVVEESPISPTNSMVTDLEEQEDTLVPGPVLVQKEEKPKFSAKDLLLGRFTEEQVDWFLGLQKLKPTLAPIEDLNAYLRKFSAEKLKPQEAIKRLSSSKIASDLVLKWLLQRIETSTVTHRDIGLGFGYFFSCKDIESAHSALLNLISKHLNEEIPQFVSCISAAWPKFWPSNELVVRHLKKIMFLSVPVKSLQPLFRLPEWRNQKPKITVQDHMKNWFTRLLNCEDDNPLELSLFDSVLRFVFRIQLVNERTLISTPWSKSSINVVLWLLQNHTKTPLASFNKQKQKVQDRLIMLMADLVLLGCELCADLDKKYPKCTLTSHFDKWRLSLCEFAHQLVEELTTKIGVTPSRQCFLALLRIAAFNPERVLQFTNSMKKMKQSGREPSVVSSALNPRAPENVTQKVVESALTVLQANQLDCVEFRGKVEALL